MLADFVAGTVWVDVAAQSHEAKRSILNFFATALGSAHDPAVSAALRTLLPFSGAATSAIIGRPERLDAMGAAFVNAISANLLDFDDTHLDTIIHPAAPVAAPVLALAQARGLSGQDVLTAFILGVEIECRVGNAVSPGHYARGWHITSTCGVFGSAAACAWLLRLPADRISNAIGIAASQSAGIVENLPSAAKNVSVGNAARNGLFAALLATEGYSASPRAIEGPLGWARAMGDEPDLERLTGGLGTTWEIAKNTYKPHPAGIVFHSVIDACFRLREKVGPRIEDIASITVEGSDVFKFANGQTASRSFTVTASAPGIFESSGGNSTGARGQTITMYITGAGAVSPAVATGSGPASGTARFGGGGRVDEVAMCVASGERVGPPGRGAVASCQVIRPRAANLGRAQRPVRRGRTVL